MLLQSQFWEVLSLSQTAHAQKSENFRLVKRECWVLMILLLLNSQKSVFKNKQGREGPLTSSQSSTPRLTVNLNSATGQIVLKAIRGGPRTS